MKNNEKIYIFSTYENIYFHYFIKLLIFISSVIFFKELIFYKYPYCIDFKKLFIPNTYRIVFVFGTRPEAIKLFPLIKELKKRKIFVCILINTGQHKEMIKQISNTPEIRNSINFKLNLMKKNQSLSKLTSKITSELEDIYNLIIPNAVIVQGDTTTAFSASVSAFYQKIPIFHVEAGLRTHNAYYPFPEEFNRVTIDDISTLYFAPTEWAASNLLNEKRNPNNIFVTGNTIVDSLQTTLNNTSPYKKVQDLIQKSTLLCSPKKCKIILLTCHRRENYYAPIYNIIKSVMELLKNFGDIVIIFPFHLNPNVKLSIKNAIPDIIYDKVIKGKKIENKNFLHLNRFIIIPPLNYFDLLHLESTCYLIMSDSGGIQEEAISLGKPILILRENTEKPEAVKLSNAFLTGTSFNRIYEYASSFLLNNNFYKNFSRNKFLYGNGNSSIIISDLIQNYFKNNLKNSIVFNYANFKKTLKQYDNFIVNNNNNDEFYDIIIVLTVWKRNNLENQLKQVKNQSILKNKKTNIIIFQNSNHVYVEDIVNKWKLYEKFPDRVDITYINSPIETGYFGRFIVPLTSLVREYTYFFVCDDDVIWGNRYFENMARVVNEGYLCTRNGRIITPYFHSTNAVFKKRNEF